MTKTVKYHYNKFPPKELNWPKIIPYIGSANAALARYDGLLSSIPNPAVLLSPLTTQEAVLSSRIEGTQATMGEILEYEAEGATRDLSPEKEADIILWDGGNNDMPFFQQFQQRRGDITGIFTIGVLRQPARNTVR